MPASAAAFLTTFALVLCTAAITTIVFQRLRQPVILGYLLAGLLIGPHTAFPFVADHQTTETLAQLGVILLLFSIGLEFSIRRLTRVGGSVIITATIDLSLMVWLGIGAASLLGWTANEGLFTGAMVAISSTTIIAKAFEEGGVGRKLRDMVFGVLIVEDLAAVLFLAGLATIGRGGATSTTTSLLATGATLVTLLFLWVTTGLFVIPQVMRRVIKTMRSETIVIASIGLCFAFALLANALGYSVALGAFIAGSMISESGRGERVAELVQPVRDVFGAVFFVAVGMLIDPTLVWEHRGAVLTLTLVVILGKFFAVSVGSFFAGAGTRTAVKAGLSMTQIGEFSFILASLGVANGTVRSFLYPVAVAVSAITALTTPWLIRWSDDVASFVDRKSPRSIQTYASLYGSWVDELRSEKSAKTTGQVIRRQLRGLLVDASMVAVLAIAAITFEPRVATWAQGAMGLDRQVTVWIVAVVAMAIGSIFVWGIARTARTLAEQVARAALPQEGKLDRAAAPRRALIVTFEILILLLTGLPLLAITQPFLPPFRGALVLALMLAVLSFMAWRSAQNLQGHLRAGAEVLVAAVRSALPPEHATVEMAIPSSDEEVDMFATATHMLPGLGSPTPFRVSDGDHGVGKSLAELDLRGRTGATVLGITREGAAIAAPSKLERLAVNDTLVLVGTVEAIEAAKEILVGAR
jgi:monovalent cation:H+ antiporter-2, CPA2 family